MSRVYVLLLGARTSLKEQRAHVRGLESELEALRDDHSRLFRKGERQRKMAASETKAFKEKLASYVTLLEELQGKITALERYREAARQMESKLKQDNARLQQQHQTLSNTKDVMALDTKVKLHHSATVTNSDAPSPHASYRSIDILPLFPPFLLKVLHVMNSSESEPRRLWRRRWPRCGMSSYKETRRKAARLH